MRDIILSLILTSLMPACFRRPFVGLVVFSWLAYMRVQDLTWGFAKHTRWSYYVAILTFAGYLLSKERRRFFLPEPRCWLLIAMTGLVGLGVLLARPPHDEAYTRYVEYVKIIAIALFTTAIVFNRERLRVMVWLIALSLGFYGVKFGIWGIKSGGTSIILQGPGGMLADNNDMALALAMATPMLFILGWTERLPLLRRAFFVILPLTVMSVGLTQSRGGFLAVSMGIGVLVWRSRNRLMGLGVGVLVAVLAFALMPASYKERLATIGEYETEGSARGRIRAWGIATRMALANPVLGVGLTKFRQHFVEHAPDAMPWEKAGKGVIVAHSSYFQIWAECGSLVLALYLGMIFSCFWTIWRIRKEARTRYFSSWILNYATMFEATLATFCVGATFLNRGHFDLLYHWVALIVVFAQLARQEMRDVTLYPVRAGVRGEIRHVPRRGFAARPGRRGFGEAAQPHGV
ncbi:MAG: putative O-glycosylation ligase, exosortase A system-associated [Planctomycetota bacterium]